MIFKEIYHKNALTISLCCKIHLEIFSFLWIFEILCVFAIIGWKRGHLRITVSYFNSTLHIVKMKSYYRCGKSKYGPDHKEEKEKETYDMV